MFQNLKIGVRLAIGFGLLVCLLIAVTALSYLRINQIDDSIEEVSKRNMPKVAQAHAAIDQVNVTARALRNAGPWGQHFPEPLFHGVFELVEQRIVGERHLKVVLKTECGSVKLDGIAFGIDRDVWPNPTIRWVELAYKLDLNEFRGNETVQLMIAHIEPR